MSKSAPALCSAPPSDERATVAPAAPDAELPRIAVMAPDPSAPGLDGQCYAGELVGPAEQKMYTAACALDVALSNASRSLTTPRGMHRSRRRYRPSIGAAVTRRTRPSWSRRSPGSFCERACSQACCPAAAQPTIAAQSRKRAS